MDPQSEIERLRAELDRSRISLEEVVRRHDEIESDWNRLLGLYRASESRGGELHGLLATERSERDGYERARDKANERARQLEEEVAGLRRRLQLTEGDSKARELELDKLKADKAAGDGRFQDLLAEHRKLCGMHEAALLEADRLGQRLAAERMQVESALAQIERLEADKVQADIALANLQGEHEKLSEQARSLAQELARIHASKSWALTRPLREARQIGSRLLSAQLLTLARKPRQLLLLPPAPGSDETGQSAGEAGGRRRHVALADFLNAEFGAAAACESIARIEHYALPVDGNAIRGAAKASCSEEQAVAWARTMAGMVAGSALDANSPDVSIVVPVHNQIRFTLACLESLIQHETRFRFEVIVGDDASNDATTAALSLPIPGVRHLRHERNLGFLRNCNAAASEARGRYVVFLNNDTLVLPNWLDELVGVLEQDASIGLSGSKLIFADGRLQECGAIIWNDGSAWNLGRGDDPRKPEYCYLRDADYVSGASIALRTDLWRKLSGFDELFVPAYAEDADLAFRVRADGYRTVVQPLSQVLHFEGVTSGTDTSQGAKAYQVENLRKLHERWRAQIACHRTNADRPDLEKERDVRRRVLFVDSVTPTPNADAGSLVAWEVMAAFRAAGYKVTFIPEDNFAHVGADTADLQRLGVETIYHPSYSFMSDFLAARHDPFDVVFLHRYKVAENHLQALRRQFPQAKFMFLNADMHFLREMREAELRNDPAALAAAQDTRDRELAVIRAVDCTLVHSDLELAMLREACPDADIQLFPLIQDPVVQPAPLRGREGVCFVAGYRHPPNGDGITWFVKEAWPKVVEQVPSARLYLAGSNATEQVVALGSEPNVEFVGFVQDIGGFLDKRRVSVAPLRYGAGAKGKVALSLAHGLPAVCTPIAAEGMQLTDGLNVRVGRTADELAEQVIVLLTDDAEWQRIASAGLAYADEVTARRHAYYRISMALERLGLA